MNTNIKQRILGYSLAQAFNLTFATTSVAMSAIVGMALCSNQSFSTVPYGTQFASVIISSYLLSQAMKRFGRKKIFFLNAVFVILAGIVGAASIYKQSFGLNILAHGLLGIGLSGFAYFRFAITDGVSDVFKSKALSLVTLGGVLAAFVGPYLASKTRNLFEYEFLGTYLLWVVMALMLMLILALIPNITNQTHDAEKAVSIENKNTKFPIVRLAAAVYSSGVGYLIMGMLMMQSSMLMNNAGISFEKITIVIQLHVAAMFLPSLFMGKLIEKYSVEKIILTGYFILIVSSVFAVYRQDYQAILIALIGIGLSWNMLYVGGSTMVALLPGDASKLQGINETAVAVLTTIGAFIAGILFNKIGWINSNIVSLFLIIPGIVLILWANMRNNEGLLPLREN